MPRLLDSGPHEVGGPSFRIYYAGGTWYDGPAFNAPALGVLVIVERDSEHGHRLVTGGDYYTWHSGRWWACDLFGLYDYLIYCAPSKVLFGRMVTNEEYRRVYNMADSDVEFPNRTAWGVYEKRLTMG